MSLSSLCSRHTVVHNTQSETTGTAGSLSPSQTQGNTHTCFIQPASTNDRLVSTQFETEISHVLYYDHDPGLEQGDEVIFGTRTFEVDARAINTDEAGRLWKVYALEKDRDQ